jgi:molecular chaperone DnaK (HSP70)
MRLGIDFGTTRTVVAAVEDGRHPIAAFDVDGEFKEYVPGIAAVADGRLVVGWEAARALAAGAAQHAIRSIKRVASTLMPDDEVPGLPGTSALDLWTAFLTELRVAIRERSNLDVSGPLEVMLSTPANAASRQRWMTIEAFRRAGFEPVGLVNEPTAAAIEFAHRHLAALGPKSPKRYVVVYDLGGGTFDTSAVTLEGRTFDLVASEGVARLGGDDFDEIILRAALVAAGMPAEVDAAGLERAREAKETLRPTSKKLLVELPDGTSVALDVAAIYAQCQPLIETTLALTEQLLGRLPGAVGDDPRALGGIYLVGGAAAFPAVARALRARFGKKLQLAAQPAAATAIGLALAADRDDTLLVREAATRHFGVWRESAHGADKVFDRLIAKDAAAGTIERRYRPAHTVGHLRFVECGALDTDGQPVQDLVPFRDVYFPYTAELADRADLAAVATERRAAVAADEIAETYTYGADGSISVRIENRSRGYARSYDLGALR